VKTAATYLVLAVMAMGLEKVARFQVPKVGEAEKSAEPSSVPVASLVYEYRRPFTVDAGAPEGKYHRMEMTVQLTLLLKRVPRLYGTPSEAFALAGV